MTLLDSIILGIVEGLTEFLPVSSKGHLILAANALGVEQRLVESYSIVVQFGALVAVVVYNWPRLMAISRGALAGDAKSRNLIAWLLIAFFPAAVAGLLVGKWTQHHLYNSTAVGAALIFGGVAMIVIERVMKTRAARTRTDLDTMTFRDALWIGCFQCLALWPGMSRSMSTIVAAQMRGFSNTTAAEFSFLLAVPSLGAGTIYKFVSSIHELQQIDGAMRAVLVGNIVAFVVAFAAIWSFIKLVARVGMTPFGIYRIIVGLAVLGLLAGHTF